MIEGNGLSLDASRSMTIDGPDPIALQKEGVTQNICSNFETASVQYREFVFGTHHSGRHLVSTSLRQAGLEEGIKNFSMIVDVREPVGKRLGESP